MKRRLLSALLALVMALTLLPVAAFATGAAEDAAPDSCGQYAPAENQVNAPDGAPAEKGQAEEPVDAAVMTAADEQSLLVAAAPDVAIDQTNFPDDNFRTFVAENYDTNKDSNLSAAEIAAVTSIDCRNKNIITMKGVEYFTALEELHCLSNPTMTTLDVSKNTALKVLDCQNCYKLTTLDVTQNTQLTYLHCGSTQLTTLDVSKNTQLKTLYCFNDQLTSLDVTQNTALEVLHCGENALTSLDVTKNAALKELSCAYNTLTSLDVTQNTALTYLHCGNASLTALDVSSNTLLEELYCYENQLTSLDLSKNTSLNSLACSKNQLTSLDSSDTAIVDPEATLFCDDNTYAITVGNARTFDLSTLPGSFDVSKASSWNGGTVNGSILTVDDGAETVTYTYDCGKSAFRTFTLNVTKRVDEQFTLTPGGRYYFDLSALGIPGTVNSNLPDSTLHYVPFTYVGTVDAYVLKSMSNGVSDSSDRASATTDKDEHSLFIAGDKVTTDISWVDLNNAGFIFGKTYTAGGINYALRAPTMGSDFKSSQCGDPDNNEWDQIIAKNSDFIKVLDNNAHVGDWGQDTCRSSNDSDSRKTARNQSNNYMRVNESASNGLGYRPVLELPTDLAADSLKAVELLLGKNMPGEQQNWINIIVKKGESFKAPSAEGLPRPDGISADAQLWWADDNFNFYKPGDTVPADVSALAAFWGGFGLFLDRGDGEVEVTPDNYTDIFGDGTASFVVPKGKTLESIAESSRLTATEQREILTTGRLGENIFPNLKLKNADLTSVTLNERYIGHNSPLFITLDGKNTIGSLNEIDRASFLSILGNGSLTLNSALTLSQYTQFGGGSVTMADGLNVYNLSVDSGSLTVTGDTQAVTLRDQNLSDLSMGDGVRLFLGSSAQDAKEAAIPQLSAEMQEIYKRYQADDNTLTSADYIALSNALREQFDAIFPQLSGKTYVRIAGAWDVTYRPGTNGKGDGVTDVKFYGDALTLRDKLFTRSGYTQTGWATADGGEKVYDFGGSYTADEALTLYPVWQMDTYAITYALDGGTAAQGNPDSYTVETDTITLKNPTRPGFTFTGWSGTGLTGENNTTVTIEKGSTGDRAYKAHWRFNPTSTGGGFGSSTSTIGATAGTGGTISPAGSVSVRRGQDQTFTITPDKSYAIADVKVDGKSVGAVTSYTFRNVTAGHSIQATFVRTTASANTADGSNLPLWSALLLMSTLSLAGAVLCQKKRAG